MNDPQILINGLNPLLVPCVGVLLTRTRTAHAVIVVRVRKVLQVSEALQRRKRPRAPLSLGNRQAYGRSYEPDLLAHVSTPRKRA